MSIFWVLFWMGFLGGIIVMVVPPLFRSSGYEKSGSHIWVYKSSGRKVRDATVRDIWRRNNPGKSWDQHQENQALGCGVVLGILLVAGLALLAGQVFDFPAIPNGRKLFWQIGGPFLGLLLGALFYAIQAEVIQYTRGFFRVLQVAAFVLLGAGTVGAIVFHFLGLPLPLSHHWLWAPLGAAFLFPIFGAISGSAQKEKSKKGGDQLFQWVDEIMMLTGMYDLKKLEVTMTLATYELEKGTYDYKVRSQEFFDLTESLMLDLVSGRQMTVRMDEVSRASTYIIKALQTFYFYAVTRFPEHDMHPRIRRALKK